jgi:hypothetical protein
MTAKRLAWALGVAYLIVGLADGGAGAAQARKGPSIHIVSSARLRNGVCTLPGLPQPSYGSTAPEVTTNPTGLDLVWTPGLNDKTCKTVQRRATAREASVLAEDIDNAPLIANAVEVNCPADDGSRVVLYFAYPNGIAGPVTIQLDGCGWTFAAGSEMRQTTATLRHDLMSFSPPPWRHYLT